MKGVKIFLANGFEDIEALATNDLLRRGGLDVELVSISDEAFVQSSQGVNVGVDNFLSNLDTSHEGTTENDLMVFPGGLPGASNLAKCEPLIELMNAHYAAGGSLAAICAAPGLVLSRLEDVKGLKFTCYQGFDKHLTSKGAEYLPEPAVRCGRIITGRSPGHTMTFALEIVKMVKGEEVAASISHDIYLY